MKKLLSMVMMLVMVLAVTPTEAQAQGLSKEEKKEAKQAAKDLAKEGWKVQGTGTIEGNMMRVMERQSQGETQLIGASLGNFPTFNKCIANARENAIREFGELYGKGIIQSRVQSDVSNTGVSDDDKLVAMAEQRFIKEIDSVLGAPVLKLYRGNGPYEMQCWWSLSEEKIKKASDIAFQNALNDVKGNRTIGEEISNFVNEE